MNAVAVVVQVSAKVRFQHRPQVEQIAVGLVQPRRAERRHHVFIGGCFACRHVRVAAVAGGEERQVEVGPEGVGRRQPAQIAEFAQRRVGPCPQRRAADGQDRFGILTQRKPRRQD